MNVTIDQTIIHAAHSHTLSAYASGDWRIVPIIECGEPLCEIPAANVYPYYARQQKLVTDERQYLRKNVLERFFRAREILHQQGYDLKVYDGWRPISLQENLFWRCLQEFTAPKFGLQEIFAPLDVPQIAERFYRLPSSVQRILIRTNSIYSSWPTSDPRSPSPHATGGAIDVWLYHHGKPVDLGVPFDGMEEAAGAFYHLQSNHKPFEGNDQQISRDREALLSAMIQAGFSCYGPEIWHFNHGNQMDALVQGGIAKYSYIEP